MNRYRTVSGLAGLASAALTLGLQSTHTAIAPAIAILLACGYCAGYMHLLSSVRRAYQKEGIFVFALLALGTAASCVASFFASGAASALHTIAFLCMGIGLALFAQMILRSRTSYPRWFAGFTPGALFCLMLPLPLALDIRLHLALACAFASSLVSSYAARRTAQ